MSSVAYCRFHMHITKLILAVVKWTNMDKAEEKKRAIVNIAKDQGTMGENSD